MNAAAAALGLDPGLPLADALARHPALDVAEADPEADRALLETIADWCGRYTPAVALDPPDGVFLEIAGSIRLFGGEAKILDDLLVRLDAQGFSVRAAIADTAGAAWGLARYGAGGIVRPGGTAAALALLPLAALRLPPETVAALGRVGLKRIGQILDAPRGPLAARFGRALLDRLDAALGLRPEPLRPRLPAPLYRAERRFAEPITHEDDVRAVILGLAKRLSRRLEAGGEGGRSFGLDLFRVDGAVKSLGVGTSRALRSPERIAELFAERLAVLHDEIDPGFGFDLVRLSALVTEPLAPAQTHLDGGSQGEDLARLVDRLAARLGMRRIARLAPQDRHSPEHADAAAPADAPMPVWEIVPEPDEPALRPLRLFARPEPIEVVAEVPDGPPVRFHWRRASHRVRRAEGPERIAPEWWRAGAVLLTRDYYRVEDDEGRRFWLFREGLYDRETAAPRWFVHGLFA